MARIGRPPKYNNCYDLECMIERYFEEIVYDNAGSEKMKDIYQVPTHAGLALFLGFSGRQQLMNLGVKPEFVDVIKRAKSRIEDIIVKLAFHFKIQPTFGMFYLKNTEPYTDVKHIDQTIDDKRKEQLTKEQREQVKKLTDKMLEQDKVSHNKDNKLKVVGK